MIPHHIFGYFTLLNRWSRAVSENVLQRELHLAHVGARAGDGAEIGLVIGVHVRVGPVRMIDGVERLPAELKVLALGEIEVLQERGIEVETTGADPGIA